MTKLIPHWLQAHSVPTFTLLTSILCICWTLWVSTQDVKVMLICSSQVILLGMPDWYYRNISSSKMLNFTEGSSYSDRSWRIGSFGIDAAIAVLTDLAYQILHIILCVLIEFGCSRQVSWFFESSMQFSNPSGFAQWKLVRPTRRFPCVVSTMMQLWSIPCSSNAALIVRTSNLGAGWKICSSVVLELTWSDLRLICGLGYLTGLLVALNAWADV